MARVPAAANVLAVLRHLGAQAAPVAAASISRDVGLPRSTTYHLLDTLVAEGFVVHVASEHRYALGLAAYELSSGYSRQAPLQRMARLPLARLVDRTGHSAHLAVLHGREVVYLVEERARGRLPLITDVGVRLPAHLTASGRALLAALPDAAVQALFHDAPDLVPRGGRGPATLADLRRRLGRARQDGHATEDEEVTAGFASVAVAVLDHTGHPVAAVALTWPVAEVDPARGAELRALTARVARELSHLAGGHR